MPLDLQPLEKAIASLLRAINRAEADRSDEELRDAVILRFGCTYELCWKMLKRRLQGEAPTPAAIDQMFFQELIREGAERGYVADPEAWLEYRRQRNITSHTYNAALAESVYQTALAFHRDAKALLQALEDRNAPS